jgi:hypothetical protein
MTFDEIEARSAAIILYDSSYICQANSYFIDGAKWQHSQDLRTMIPREKVEKLLERLEIIAKAHPPNMISMHVGKALADFHHPEGKDEK